jgi:hypothetical protein
MTRQQLTVGAFWLALIVGATWLASAIGYWLTGVPG